MWKVQLHIINHFLDTEGVKTYCFKPILQYKNLHEYLPKILPHLDLTHYIVDFYFTYLNKTVLVDDLEKYILNNDLIEIHLNFNDKQQYFLRDSYNDENLYVSPNIDDIYTYYKDSILNHDFPLLIYREKYNKYNLIDVLENPDYYINSCINRMVHKYGQKGY